MKKIFYLFVLFAVCFSCGAGAFSNPSVTDGADLLFEYEYDELSEKLDSLRKKYNMDIAIYTEDEMSYKNAEASADNIFDYNGYGPDGILLYICMDERTYHITTSGEAVDIFGKSAVKTLKKNVEKHLKEDEWYDAFNAFSDTVSDILGGNTVSSETEEGGSAGVIVTLIILPPVIALIAMLIKSRKMKTATAKEYASDYMNNGSFNLTASRDMFLYSTITKTERPRSNSSGTHRSSSGRIHGGGGGSF